ncbi:zinc dependent phospholipase C [Clostridium acetireducens DSM 10703]|jgi:phospholipase C|uniref:Phospholipase C n=1 Tax=Clostridium acetireducens DSM 10703 TaxID=1121290 RepID=A0A1E8EXR8_9CLOT|nr:zinc dependent phospholipase C family protein [Clostridium acetireducens]OFI05592.1 zinc dependent phospholipase C [Clostridium acetireducens DSM 10703]
MKIQLEKTYGSALKKVFYAVNPLKKKFLKTYCTVHKFIIIQSLEILKNNGCIDEYNFYKDYVKNLNNGVTWADQDFKSSNHFYHYSRGKGLYGFSDALTECKKYYNKSLAYAEIGDIERAVFYLGAACHLVQDTTVPQHVNNKLLRSHRKFELWIISKLMTDYSFIENKCIIRYNTLEEYIKNNAILANSVYIKNLNIRDRDERYYKIAVAILKQAQKTTAGLLLDYYQLIQTK